MSTPRPNKNYIILEPLLLAIVMIIGITIGYKINDSEDDFSLITRLDENATPIGKIEEVLRFIENKYVDSIDTDEIENKLINSILDELDPHSVYIPPKDIEVINRQMAGRYLGIGIETIEIQDTFYISKIFPGGPADENGLLIGDKLLEVNDSIVAGRNYTYGSLSESIVKKELLELKVLTKKGKRELSLIPRELKLNSAKIHYFVKDNIGYIRLERFTSKSYAEFMQALESLITENSLENLLIDLRDNPGGYLPQANKILSQLFKEKDKLMLFTEGVHSKKIEYKTTGKSFFDIQNIAVLINDGSASGSEILAGAIQDWDRGVIIGQRSYGKGLVQEQYGLHNGGAIRLTVAEYFTPSGRLIQKPYKETPNQNESNQELRISGNHFYNQDSLDATTSYTTKLLKRKVEGGGGIKPDIEVEINENLYDTNFNLLVENLRITLFKEFLNNKWSLAKEDFPLNSIQSRTILEALKEMHPDLSFNITKLQSELSAEANFFLAKLNHGEVFASSNDSSFDPVIIKAIEALQNKSLLAQYVD